MLSPDSVSLVSPPSATAPKAIPAHPASHQPTTRGADFGAAEAASAVAAPESADHHWRP